MEKWKTVLGYDGLYEISNLGRVKSLPRKKVVKKFGHYVTKEKFLRYPLIRYPHVILTNSYGIRKTELIHRLIATAFIPNPESKPEVNHINANPKDFSISNLEWVTKSENGLHAFKVGAKKAIRGELNVSSKLTNRQVLEIRNQYTDGTCTQRSIAAKYGVSQARVCNILNFKAR